MPSQHATRPVRLGATLAATTLLLSACATTAGVAPAASRPGSPTSAKPAASATGVGGNSKEVRQQTTRLLVSHADGLTLLDATSGDVVDQTHRPGFLRLNNAGDGRHVLVTEGDRFLVYDAGVQSRPHGDHAHHYTYNPGLTGLEYPAPHAGHAVPNAGRTTMFADGTGEIQVVETAFIADETATIQRSRTDAPHHGVALVLSDDTLLTTQGTQESRSTVQVRRGDQVVAQTDDCPGVHGEATAKPTASGDVVLLGCTNGPVVWRDGAFHKVSAPDVYARTGNAAGSHASPIVLTDYKSEQGAEHERPTRVALVDTRTDRLSLVELGSSYWFRSLARGPHGEALVLTYDGAVKVIDPDQGTVTASIPAIDAWTEHSDWQQPGPSIKVAGHLAFVADAAASRVVVVDLEKGSVVRSIALPHTPVELAVIDGIPESSARGHAEHDHAEGKADSADHSGHNDADDVDHSGHSHG